MDPQLLKAVSNGDADLLAQILSTTTIAEESRCACLEGVTAEGSSALHIAARHGYLKLVEMICDQDISLIKARNNLLDTPLICAARAGHVDVVDCLIQLASTQRDTEYVLRAWNSSGATAVHEAVRNGHASVLGKLVSGDARLSAAVDGQGVSPLYMAVVSNQADMVDILIRESREGSVKSPASYAGPDGQAALHAAVFAGNAASGKTRVVKLLLVNSLHAYIPDDDGLYPVHYAAIAGNSEIIREIMEICPSCDELVDKKHRSILHCAIEFNRAKFMNMYMELSLLLCEAYSIPSRVARSLSYNHCLEDDKESSRYSDMSQSMLCLSVFIAAGSFAAAFTPPGNYIIKDENAAMGLFDDESPFLSYVDANSVSFCLSAIATCQLMHASLATTPIRQRRYYLQLSAVMLALDPQKSRRECLLF
ncbi:unnamed protein product [Miscanthus lutarioriparius]|uniref:PGG domain-containing protein n=1 Tax=Miscanthus lutarioriparius TaxID=422564 RepID=A0A811RRJ5_9POAL|nr:unnamed protein product [Miscanthus lutarioriparius]